MDMKRTKAEVKAIVARSKHLRELLDYFGLVLVGFDPGVSARNPNATDYFKRLSYNFDSQEWAWLEPLLVELRDLRIYRKRIESDY